VPKHIPISVMDKARITKSQQQSSPRPSLNNGDKAAKGYPAATRFAQAPSPSAGGGNSLPHQLREGVETLSGMSMGDTSVHYNSSAPARIGALAYAAGNQIHLGPGQEQHLPHEAWHVVQQKQGRVKPTLQAKGLAINDDQALETEADMMGQRAMRLKIPHQLPSALQGQSMPPVTDVVQRKIGFEFQAYGCSNIIGAIGPFGKHPEGLFNMKVDIGLGSNIELEIVTKPVDETSDGIDELTRIMDAIGLFLGQIKPGTKLNEVKGIDWNTDVMNLETAEIKILGPELHFHPQATVGVKFEAVADLIDYVTKAAFKTGGIEAKAETKEEAMPDATPAATLATPGETKAEVATVDDKKQNALKYANVFGWSGKEDQRSFKKAWAKGLESAKKAIPGRFPKALGFAAILYGFLENESDDIKPVDNSHPKYFMPFMLRNGLMPFFDSMEAAEQEMILKLNFKSERESKTPVRSVMSGLAKKEDYFVKKGVEGHGQILKHNLTDWGMGTVDDIGSLKEEPVRRGAIIELRKLGNDVRADQLKAFALAVFDLVSLINATGGTEAVTSASVTPAPAPSTHAPEPATERMLPELAELLPHDDVEAEPALPVVPDLEGLEDMELPPPPPAPTIAEPRT
jgi:hypothetical protein